jgi:phosphate starvation-inducible PhoH-like protein
LSRRSQRNAERASNTKNYRRSTKQKQYTDDNIVSLDNYRVPAKNKVKLLPKNLKQETYIEYLEDINNDLIVAMGSAGTGKTLIATTFAIKEFLDGRIKKIVITRPNVAVDDRGIGHLPGNLIEKMMPFVRPIMDIFLEYFSKAQLTKLLEEETIEICPIAMIRGRTFKNSILILDEAQGTTPSSLKAILTRIGENSRIILTGDIEQSDITENGLIDFVARLEGQDIPGIKMIQFTKYDVERHPMVAKILTLYED